MRNLRRIDALTGLISTVAGGGDVLGEDIPAATAALGGTFAFDFDVEGNLFIPEWSAHRIRAVHLSPSFTYEIVEAPLHGLASVSPDGELHYEPNSDFVGSDTITFRARDAVGRLTPTATLSITVTAIPDADVAVAVTALPSAGVSAEGKITYTIAVTNHGPAEATGIVLTDTLPTGINLNFVTVTTSQGTCRQSLGLVTCDLGSMANDATAAVTIVVHPLNTAAKINVATVAADQVDPDTANNTRVVFSGLTGVVLTDLRLTQIDSPDPMVERRPLTYQLTVTNLQNSCANDVFVSDVLPQRVNLVSVTPTQGTCTGLSCNVGRLCPGESAAITIVVTATAAGTLVNTAAVQDRPSDPVGNNTATATTRVVPATVVLNVAETVGVSDSVRLLPAALIKVSESVVVSDTVLVVPPVVLRISEAVSVLDGVGVIPPVVIRVSESVGVTDGVRLLPAIIIKVTESVTVTDSPIVR